MIKQMKLSVSRLAGFADALIAIVITLMVLEIPLPETMETANLLTFGKSILIFFASFIIVGTQWHRHHHLLDGMEKISDSFIWKNLIYFFFLSLMPLFMKWLILFPSELIPAVCYVVLYMLCDFMMRIMFISRIKKTGATIYSRNKPVIVHMAISIAFITATLLLSAAIPLFSVICFIVFPVIMSIMNLFEKENRYETEDSLVE